MPRTLTIDGANYVLTDDGCLYGSWESPLMAKETVEVEVGEDRHHTILGLLASMESAAKLLRVASKATKAELLEAIEAAREELTVTLAVVYEPESSYITIELSEEG